MVICCFRSMRAGSLPKRTAKVSSQSPGVVHPTRTDMKVSTFPTEQPRPHRLLLRRNSSSPTPWQHLPPVQPPHPLSSLSAKLPLRLHDLILTPNPPSRLLCPAPTAPRPPVQLPTPSSALPESALRLLPDLRWATKPSGPLSTARTAPRCRMRRIRIRTKMRWACRCGRA